MNLEIIFLYSIVSFFYVVSPGPAVFLAIANGVSENMKVVAISSFGNILGLFFLSTISIIGLGSLIMASSKLFFLVKVIGAAYLIYMGVKKLKSSKTLCASSLQTNAQKNRSHLSYFFESLFLAATNPKPILFFVAIFPQFLNIQIPLTPQFFTMTAIFMSLSFVSLLCYGYLAKSIKKMISNNNGMKWFHRITGGLFIGMGLGLLQLKNASS